MIMVVLTTLILLWFASKKNEPAVFGIYKQRSRTYWFKFICMYVYLRLRQLINHIKKLLAVESGQSPDDTVHVQAHDVKLEQIYNLEGSSKAVDAVYFNGMCENGDVIICGLARRPNRICDSFMYLKVSGEDLLLTPDLPDSYLHKSEDNTEEYNVKGLTITKFIPMRAWTLSYKGEMKTNNSLSRTVKVEADLTWSAHFSQFEYDTQMSPRSVADDMAREPWSREYFNMLKKLHQTHYEQMGFIAGNVFIDGKKYELNMPCLRDRSFGKLREWRNFHRYVLHFIFLDNGDCIAVGSVSQPSILSHLTIGYLCRKADQSVVAVDYSDFRLYQHAENQILPKSYGFVFEAGGQSYAVQVNLISEEMFYIGKDREAKLYERWSDIEINGVKGRACVEWHYNNVLNK